MTTIVYNGYAIAADNKVVRKEFEWNMHQAHGTKLFVNDKKTIAFTLVGATVPEHERKDLFEYLEKVLPAYEQTMNRELLKCHEIAHFENRTFYIITAKNFYTAFNSYDKSVGHYITHETEKPNTSHGTGNAPAIFMLDRGMALNEIYATLAKVDYLTSATYNSYSQNDLRPFVEGANDE